MLTFRENLNGLHIQDLAATECYELIPMGSREKITIQTLQVFEQHRKIVLGDCSPRDYQPRYLCQFCQKVAHHHGALGEAYLLPRIPHHVQQGREITLNFIGCDVACMSRANPISFSTSMHWCSFHLLPALGHQSKSSMLIHRLSAKFQKDLWLLLQIIDSASLQFERC